MISKSYRKTSVSAIVMYTFRIIELCQEQPDGITDSIIMKDVPLCTPQQRVTAINTLLSTVSTLMAHIFYFFLTAFFKKL